MRQYAIPFRGLKEGRHYFKFVSDNKFFEQFDSSEIRMGLVTTDVELIKHTQFLELHFNLKGKVTVNCDRCLEPFAMAIEHEAVLYIRFGKESYEQSEEVVILADTANELDLGQYLYEFIHLALPYQRVHPEVDGHSGCHPEMVKKLKDHTISEEPDSRDPRWEKLEGLFNKLN
jgi:uncharacterized metal-binding protein YceD (DUF177 family)